MKLDENLGERGKDQLVAAGHDVATVAEQGLSSAQDPVLIEVCRREQRCLVTLDLDYSNPLVFRPRDYAGIAVLRLPRRSRPADLYTAVDVLIGGLSRESIEGKLWIVDRSRIRQYQPNDND